MTTPVNNYIQLADRTSSPVMPCESRLRDPKMLALLFYEMSRLALMADRLDILKRAIYYGKPTPPHDLMLSETRQEIASEMLGAQVVELLHAGIGMVTEAGEFMSALHDHLFNGAELDVTNLKEEIGDVQWYLAKACLHTGTTLEAEQERNIAKLRARFPDKFTDESALNRDLETERKVLES